MRPSHCHLVLLSVLMGGLLSSAGCRRPVPPPITPELTATSVRAARRAFDGAPPVIPHQPLGADCRVCHTATGQAVAHHGYAPANPHGALGSFHNCRQCHLFQRDENEFAENQFVGLEQVITPAERLFPGAPPVIPHDMTTRHNCQACHSGPAARPEIRCSHPERVNCTQCHVPTSSATPFAVATSD